MPATPIGRIATSTHLDLLLSGLRRLQDDLAKKELEISTGQRVNVPSDDPLAAIRSLSHRAGLERADQYLRNISLQSGELSAADGALEGLDTITSQARQILLSQIGDTATPETRRNSAAEVQGLLEQAVSLANRKFGGRYLFGGADALHAPVELQGAYAAFNPGALETSQVHIGPGESFRRAVSNADAFGAVSAEILGRADLDPRVTLSTKLSDLNGGQGARLGPIRIQDGLGGDATVDLSSAETVGNVIDLINSTGLATASLNGAGNGLLLSAAGGELTVSEVEGGRTAGDLGIALSGAGPALTGSDLDPRLRLTTLLSDLRGGSGIDLSGFTVANGTVSAAISLSGATTVEDLLNAVNGAGANVVASLDPSGRSIDLRSTLSGAQLTLTEGSGTTAADLGLLIDFGSTPLERLNGGLGVGQASGDDLRIVDHAGNTIDVDLAGVVTVQQLLDRINGDSQNPGTLTASLVPGENRIRLTDGSVGAQDLQVQSLNGSFSAENLGLAGSVANPGATLDGTDLKPGGVQVDSLLSALVALRDGLNGDDRSVLSLVGAKLDASENRLLDARADLGSRVQRLEKTSGRFTDDKIQLQKLISDERGADLAESVSQFQRDQTVLQASYSVTGRILSLSLMDFLR
jgi:flagellar hook-associated protein 3 FlgL